MISGQPDIILSFITIYLDNLLIPAKIKTNTPLASGLIPFNKSFSKIYLYPFTLHN